MPPNAAAFDTGEVDAENRLDLCEYPRQSACDRSALIHFRGRGKFKCHLGPRAWQAALFFTLCIELVMEVAKSLGLHPILGPVAMVLFQF